MDTDRLRRAVVQNPLNIQAMFNAIAPKYDVLNHLLSFGLDIRWRKRALKLVEEKRKGKFLDIAAGSGDLSIEAIGLQPQMIVATDFAANMLGVFRDKLNDRKITNPIHLASCDALHLPFTVDTFDLTMVAFGVRNFSDRLLGLKEMLRVLRPGGVCLILELTTPKLPVIAHLYNLYSKSILPMIGKIISRHNLAYSYLPTSISEFPADEQFLSLMKEAGFREPSASFLTFGVATIYTGRK
ncbi:MAG: bifunctional demethylmenaquinone methyltransferase/2-methoxy-6-polyprenyl-1,4-benzoquinol methylase UbiE [Bacteroidota bacterium]|jgi:demethylmenaquinone methyltransferase/2-methoxy-6-polyprenyl-1,4-benzoquinol methylase